MKLSELTKLVTSLYVKEDPDVEFVGIKWQEEHHPSAQLFPIDFVSARASGDNKVTLKFITTKHNQ